MIVVYPMLISQSVSPNVLPGLAKAVEKYILLYNTDAVLRAASATSAGRLLSFSGKLAAGAAATAAGILVAKAMDKMFKEDTLVEQEESPTKDDNLKLPKPTPKPTRTAPVVPIRSGSGIKPSLDIPGRGETVSLEPTWMSITTEKKGLQVLGVKVVPFQVKSTDNLVDLISNDAQLKGLDQLLTKYGRSITRVFVRIAQKLKIPGIKGGTVTGDPKKDVIYAHTKFKKDIFVCMTQLDLQASNITSTPAGVQKLHKLGWASFIVMDDVNKHATFCMKQFGGVCSVVPYNFMFASFGKELNKAYEDLEDLRRSSGPFFNMRTNRKRIFSEGKSVTDKYLELIQRS